MSNDLWTLKIQIQNLNAMHFTRANSCRSLLHSIWNKSLISMANYYLTLKFKILCLKSSTFVEYVRLPEYQKKNPQSTGEIVFLLKTRLHWKLLAKYIVLQVPAKTSFITLYNWNFSLVYCDILLVTHSWKRHRLVASWQFYQLVATCEQVATSLSISSSCNKSVKIRLVENCHLQTCYNLLNKLQACWNNQLATSLFTTCKRLVINKLSPAMQTHPDIGLL